MFKGLRDSSHIFNNNLGEEKSISEYFYLHLYMYIILKSNGTIKLRNTKWQNIFVI